MFTNYELFKNLTLEELAGRICTLQTSEYMNKYCKNDCNDENSCPHEVECCIKWLGEKAN